MHRGGRGHRWRFINSIRLFTNNAFCWKEHRHDGARQPLQAILGARSSALVETVERALKANRTHQVALTNGEGIRQWGVVNMNMYIGQRLELRGILEQELRSASTLDRKTATNPLIDLENLDNVCGQPTGNDPAHNLE